MEYIYSAMLLHKAGKEVNANNVKNILQAAGISVDEGRVKALVAALDGINIEDAIKQAAVPIAESSAQKGNQETKKKEEPKEEKKTEEQAAAGLGALFG